MPILLDDIYRHPVKGLTPERLDSAQVTAGQALPNDRRFALALGSTPVDGAIAEWMPKSSFLMLMRNEKLAQLQTVFDDETATLTVLRGGRQVARGNLTQRIGRTMIEDFFAAFMGGEARGRPTVVEAAAGHTMSDHANPVLSIINRESVADMARVVGKPVDPRRFRGNLLISGGRPWREFEWLGKTLRIGTATFVVTERIDRCGATNVNPDTAERDLNIPKSLQMGYGHIDCGVYARVVADGSIAAGDELLIEE